MIRCPICEGTGVVQSEPDLTPYRPEPSAPPTGMVWWQSEDLCPCCDGAGQFTLEDPPCPK
jgi:hypothetical protein